MSATIVVLPVIRVEHYGDSADNTVVVAHLSKSDFARLKRAREWKMPIADAAAAVISNALDPKKK